MLTREQNELLCRVEGDAPMGGIMRRHWLPVCLSEEVAERDGAPVLYSEHRYPADRTTFEIEFSLRTGVLQHA